jgi:hypothetical protein
MADFISDLATKAGISPDLAKKGVGAILALCKDRLPAGSFSQVQSVIPDSSDLMAAAEVPEESSSGGIFAAVGTAIKKLVRGSTAELISRFTKLGFSEDQLKVFLPRVLEFLKSKLPADVVKQASALLPGVKTEG